MRKKIRIFGLLVVLLVVAVPLAGAWVSSYLHRPLPVDEPRVVGVEPGEGLSRVLWKLKGEGILGAAQEADSAVWAPVCIAALPAWTRVCT